MFQKSFLTYRKLLIMDSRMFGFLISCFLLMRKIRVSCINADISLAHSRLAVRIGMISFMSA